jgi:hypothetical protein
MGRISLSNDTVGEVKLAHESNGATASASAGLTGQTPPSIPPVSQDPPLELSLPPLDPPFDPPFELPLPPPVLEPLSPTPPLPVEHAGSAASAAVTTRKAMKPKWRCMRGPFQKKNPLLL